MRIINVRKFSVRKVGLLHRVSKNTRYKVFFAAQCQELYFHLYLFIFLRAFHTMNCGGRLIVTGASSRLAQIVIQRLLDTHKIPPSEIIAVAINREARRLEGKGY